MNTELISTIEHLEDIFVGGEWASASSSKTIDVFEASTEEILFQVADAQAADLDRAITAARDAFDHGVWPRLTHRERADYIRRIGERLAARSELLGHVWTGESGIVLPRSIASASNITLLTERWAQLADTFEFEEEVEPTAGGVVAFRVSEPVGVVGAIIPWNSPQNLTINKVAPALLAGCTVVIKMSPEAPGFGYIFAEAAREAGIPAGVVNVMAADREVSQLLVTDPRVDKITFTGSTSTGKRIASLLGGRIARYTLELGGKSPAIILDDYDVEEAAASIASTACLVTGQSCSSLTRIIVDRSRHDDLVEALAESFGTLRVGDPYSDQTEMGPLASLAQRDRVEHYLRAGRDSDAWLAAGGGRPKHLERGYFIEPTVFGNVDNNSRIGREEIFGPVLSVIPADGEDHAIEIANDTDFGLNASVFTNDPDRALAVARKIRSGTVGHNAFRTDFGVGFGGYKQSGVGREGGPEGLRAFLEMKSIILNARPTSTQSERVSS